MKTIVEFSASAGVFAFVNNALRYSTPKYIVFYF